ncbi:ABC transporter permease [Cytobacillus praedii]|uniref:ABC transporter permease n=1 Tax=Cytobacillus praedii TaxID=1742358 RepID=UPI00070C0D16|nr:ABC transporter permease [Cytobacillus praedii]
MRIIIEEMKKIFHPVMLLICLLINLLMYYIFIDFDISVFPNGRPATDMYNIGIEMVDKYGHELDENELKDFTKVLQQEIKKADKYIQADKEFSNLGITSYREFIDMRKENQENPEIDLLSSKIMFDKEIDLFWEIPQRENVIEKMEFVNERYGYSDLVQLPTSKQDQRIQEIIQSGKVNAIFPSYPVEYNFQTISQSIAITILVSVIFMISPIFIRDYKNNMFGLQYSSKIGRGLVLKKVTAGMLATFIITTFLIIVYYGLYSTNDIGMFLESEINSFMGTVYWYDFSFLQLIIMTILLTYVITLSLSLLAIFVSSICKNYISIIGIQLPLFAVLYWLIKKRVLPVEAFHLTSSQWEIGMIYSIMIIIPISVIGWIVRNRQTKDILE